MNMHDKLRQSFNLDNSPLSKPTVTSLRGASIGAFVVITGIDLIEFVCNDAFPPTRLLIFTFDYDQ